MEVYIWIVNSHYDGHQDYNCMLPTGVSSGRGPSPYTVPPTPTSDPDLNLGSRWRLVVTLGLVQEPTEMSDPPGCRRWSISTSFLNSSGTLNPRIQSCDGYHFYAWVLRVRYQSSGDPWVDDFHSCPTGFSVTRSVGSVSNLHLKQTSRSLPSVVQSTVRSIWKTLSS